MTKEPNSWELSFQNLLQKAGIQLFPTTACNKKIALWNLCTTPWAKPFRLLFIFITLEQYNRPKLLQTPSWLLLCMQLNVLHMLVLNLPFIMDLLALQNLHQNQVDHHLQHENPK